MHRDPTPPADRLKEADDAMVAAVRRSGRGKGERVKQAMVRIARRTLRRSTTTLNDSQLGIVYVTRISFTYGIIRPTTRQRRKSR